MSSHHQGNAGKRFIVKTGILESHFPVLSQLTTGKGVHFSQSRQSDTMYSFIVLLLTLLLFLSTTVGKVLSVVE